MSSFHDTVFIRVSSLNSLLGSSLQPSSESVDDAFDLSYFVDACPVGFWLSCLYQQRRPNSQFPFCSQFSHIGG